MATRRQLLALPLALAALKLPMPTEASTLGDGTRFRSAMEQHGTRYLSAIEQHAALRYGPHWEDKLDKRWFRADKPIYVRYDDEGQPHFSAQYDYGMARYYPENGVHVPISDVLLVAPRTYQDFLASTEGKHNVPIALSRLIPDGHVYNMPVEVLRDIREQERVWDFFYE